MLGTRLCTNGQVTVGHVCVCMWGGGGEAPTSRDISGEGRAGRALSRARATRALEPVPGDAHSALALSIHDRYEGFRALSMCGPPCFVTLQGSPQDVSMPRRKVVSHVGRGH